MCILKNKELVTLRLYFLYVGLCVVIVAPLFPYILNKLYLSTIALASLMAAISLGSFIGMILAVKILKKVGFKNTFYVASFNLFILINALCVLDELNLLRLASFLYGFHIGFLEVSLNIYGSYLEQREKKLLLSNFHGFYSLGEIVALLCIQLLVTLNFNLKDVLFSLILTVFLIVTCYFKNLENFIVFNEKREFKRVYSPLIFFLAIITSFIFMVEGAMLDWSSLYLITYTNIDSSIASSGYLILVIFMMLSRFTGRWQIECFGQRKVVIYGVFLAFIALFLLSNINSYYFAYLLFALLGFAIANIMPITIKNASLQDNMPKLLALSWISVAGYLGLVLGPVFIGILSHLSNLKLSFLLLSFILVVLLVAILCNKKVFVFAR